MATGTPTWKGYYRQIVDGTDVKAAVTNVPSDDLFNLISYLKNTVDTLTTGRSVILTEQLLASATVQGTPVYLDTDGTWKPAYAELSSSTNSTLFQLTSKSYVAGVVSAKSTATRGTVTLFGEINTTAAILALVEGTYVPGAVYYLSPMYPGMLTASKGVAPVRACLIYGPDISGNYKIIVNPDQRSQVEHHGHYRFELEDEPAGEAGCVPKKEGFLWGELEPEGPYPGIIHTIINADSSLPGWLPVNDPIFSGMTIPTGAKFGYNISQNTELSTMWPPMPIDHVLVTVDGNDETDNLVVVNEDGIWWMDDDYGKAPWPVNLPCSSDGSSSSSSYPIWPIRITLWFTRTLHGTTLDAINNQISLKSGIYPPLEPVTVGIDIEPTVVDNIRAYKLVPVSGSSSGAGEVDPTVLLYSFSGRDYAVTGRTINMRLTATVGADAAATATAVANLISGLTLNIKRLPDPGLLEGDLSTVVDEPIAWEIYPTNLTSVPAGKYFVVQSESFEVDSNDLIYAYLTWNGGVLVGTDEGRLYAFRPVIE
jgi:hypothetical protein